MRGLSEAIERGIRRSKGQAQGDYFEQDGLASALGSAVLGLDFSIGAAKAEPVQAFSMLSREVQSLGASVRCPLCRAIKRLDEVVELHLNDGACGHGTLSREEIVAWLRKKVEQKPAASGGRQEVTGVQQ